MTVFYNVKPVGVVRSDLRTREEVRDTRIEDHEAAIEVFAEYESGLRDIDGFSHIVVVSWMHESSRKPLLVHPRPKPEQVRGVFATCSPDRPNPIGLTVVELLERQGRLLRVKGLDMIDGTPIVDVKPYTKSFQKAATDYGWLSG